MRQEPLDWLSHMKAGEMAKWFSLGVKIVGAAKQRKILRDRAYQRARRAAEKERVS